MAWFTGINHEGLLNGGGPLIHSLLASSALFGITQAFPLSEQSNTTSANLISDSTLLQTTWSFNCYSASKACRGTGNTSGGSSSKHACASIAAAGCTRYTFNGGGEFKLCLYEETDCGGTLLTSVNGGSVTCLDLDSPKSFKVVIRDTDC
ncbi:uncharacterized protein N7484_000352 [Penicillium longicatenatum]|uniref:uncharacterized protein n=1 Tax=Penicillium longicatenatum TaxID=1561947 RepID=UPI0025480907|nr:uncharacterized protein N7484_000352 [Penicillium longicatenatum]KAJ5660980.1 hypothetical protein N7484_000352 [Penicillium longicatenatum]